MNVYNKRTIRELLRAYRAEIRKSNPGLSYRALGRRLGLRSQTYFWKALNGQKNLSNAVALRMAREIGFSQRETLYLICLSAKDSARNPAERRFFAETLRWLAKGRR